MLYRPKTFDEVMGQNASIKELKRRVQEQNIPHVTILAGDTGTGKTTTALILAAAINCKDLRDGNPCGACASCRDIFGETFDRSTRYLDASSMGKEDILALSTTLEGASFFHEKKVVLIDEAQELSSKAFGACLRLLESNDENLYFILCTMRPDKIDRAILSRGTVYKYKALDFDGVLDALAQELTRRGIFESLEKEFIEDGLMVIAENSHGSVREALQNLERALASKLYTKEALEKELGLTESSSIRLMLESYVKKDQLGFITCVRKLSAADLWSVFSKAMAEVVTYMTIDESLYGINNRLVKGLRVSNPAGALQALADSIGASRKALGYDATEFIVGNLMARWFLTSDSVVMPPPVAVAPQPVVVSVPVGRRRVVK